jgi:hypothetical protein
VLRAQRSERAAVELRPHRTGSLATLFRRGLCAPAVAEARTQQSLAAYSESGLHGHVTPPNPGGVLMLSLRGGKFCFKQ